MDFLAMKMKFCTVTFLFLCITAVGLAGFVSAQTVTTPPTPSANQFTASLNSVSVINNAAGNTQKNLSDYEAWAVGLTGTILHWDGKNWTQSVSPTQDTLYGVHMVNASSGWAVGGSLTRGIILNYDGNNWTEYTNVFNPVTGNASITTQLNSVAFNENGTFGLAVGPQGSMYQWNGSGWMGTPQMNITLHGISIPAHSSDAWVACNNGTILHWSNGAWSLQKINSTASIRSVAVTNSSSGWAVGGDDGVGVILALNGTGWSKWNKISFTANSSSDKVNTTLNSMAMATSDFGWAVGEGGWMLKWNGSVWVGETGSTSNALMAVSMPQNVTSVAWAVGGSGTILGWNGAKWSPIHATDIPEIPVIAVTILSIALFSTVSVAVARVRSRRKFNLS